MSKSSSFYELLTPTEIENTHLDKLDPAYLNVSEMTLQDRQFLHALVKRNQPNKLLELGVSAGSSSVIMLHAMDKSTARLFSVDYSEFYYQDESKMTGFIIDKYPSLRTKWELFTGGLVLEFLPKIGGGIDFCFIDAAHMNPGELLDTLMVLPYLKDDAIIVYHDVNLPTFRQKVSYSINRTLTNNLLMSAVHGKKILQNDFDWDYDPRTYFPNIGAIQINKESKQHVFEIINLLTLSWSYLPTIAEEKAIIDFMLIYYDKYLVDYVSRIFDYQRHKLKLGKKARLYTSVKNMTKSTLGRHATSKFKVAVRNLKR